MTSNTACLLFAFGFRFGGWLGRCIGLVTDDIFERANAERGAFLATYSNGDGAESHGVGL